MLGEEYFEGNRLIVLAAEEANAPDVLLDRLPTTMDAVVLDHYDLDHAFEAALHGRIGMLCAIDDLANRRHDCDILIDCTPGRRDAAYASRVPDRCRLMLGPGFALLRPAFINARSASLARRRETGAPRRLLVSFGMTDPGNLTEQALRGISESGLAVAIDVVLGTAAAALGQVRDRLASMTQKVTLHVDAASATMAELGAAADLAIGAGGGSALERCCLGLPSITLAAADNQKLNLQGLIQAEAVISLADDDRPLTERIAESLREVWRSPTTLVSVSANAARLCDGLGADRIAGEMDAQRRAA